MAHVAFPDRIRTGQRWLEIGALASAYFVTAQVGQLFAVPPGNVTPVWIPSGIILAAILVRGYHLWPGVFLGAFAGNAWAYFDASSAQSMLASLLAGASNGLGDTLCAVVGAYLVTRASGSRYPLDSARGIAALILYGALGGAVISASFGVTGLCLSGMVPWREYVTLWLTWCIGDGVGVLVVTPPLLAWGRAAGKWRPGQEDFLFALALLVTTSLILGLTKPLLDIRLPMLVIVPALMWSVFRLDPRVTFASLAGVALLSIVSTAVGAGWFSGMEMNVALVELQLFLSTVCITTLVLHGVVQDRTAARRSLQQANALLERKVEQRTEDLLETQNALRQEVLETASLNQQLERHKRNLQHMVRRRTRELIEARDRAEIANRTKSAFIANMSHEMRTPMNAIIGLTYLLKHANLRAEDANKVEQINQAGKELLSLIDEVLDLSKLDTKELCLTREPFHLPTLLREVSESLERATGKKDIEVTVDGSDTAEWWLGDSARLKQALMNYVNNAVKFTRQGTIGVRVRAIGQQENDTLLRFEVEDTGEGVDPKRLPDLFGDFTTGDDSPSRQYGGAGLGLAITQRLARLMGGEAGAESMPGQGSLFWFTARLQPARADTGDTEEVGVEGPGPSSRKHRATARHVLLVESDVVNRQITKTLLVQQGFDVLAFEDGRKVLAQIRASDVQLALVDIELADSHGYEAIREIRSLGDAFDFPILAMAADTRDPRQSEHEAAGITAIVEKPVDPEILLTALKKWLPEPALP